MSGIVGIINLDGTPVDRELLGRMTDFMSFRGPDTQEIWIDGNVGFGHTMLRTTFEAETEKQPLTLDGKVWLTADARIDGRAELIAELEGKLRRRLRLPVPSNGHGSPSNDHGSPSNAHGSDTRAPNDAELILYSYEAWGEDCVKHLIGDFAFAIWDSRQRRLFCARDHFGVKPFYYAHLGSRLLFSNTLNCLRRHPAVSSRLNDEAVGDFLLFDMNCNLFSTVFADIQRLPPAHCLTLTEGKPHVCRYWTLPVNGRVRYKRSGEYVDQFKQLLSLAVGDRLRTDRVGIFMSGGLDSTAIAAAARERLAKRAEPFDLQAYTVVYERLIPDNEGYFAGLVAKALGIPINYLVADNYRLCERWSQPEMRRPEPVPDPLVAIAADQYRQLAANSRVALSGQGPDAILSTFFPRHLNSLLKRGRFIQAFMDVGQYPYWHKRLPPIGVRTLLRRCLGRIPPSRSVQLPSWLNPEFVARMGLEDRSREINSESAPMHDTHPVAHNLLAGPFWPYLFERDSSDVSFLAVENRYPFFDLRLLTYLLAIPLVPFCVDKKVLRTAMFGILPETVRLRLKSPVAGNVLVARTNKGEKPALDTMNSLPELDKYVIPTNARKAEWQSSSELWNDLRLLSFYNWMIYTLGPKDEFAKKANRAIAG